MIGGIRLIERDDRATYKYSIEPNIHREQYEIYTIVVDHNPNRGDVGEFEYDLQLSGYTHAGQVFPGNLYIRLTRGYTYGFYSAYGNNLIVSSGAGVGRYPIRTCKNCEYVVITIKPDK